MKIVYVIDSLGSKGGAERILSDKMSYLADHFGYDVHVVTCYQNPSVTPNVYPLSYRVGQTNLCIPYYSQYKYGYPQRLWVKWGLYRDFCRRLTETVQRLDPDVLVGLGYFQADVVTAIPCCAMKVVESHEARLFTMSDSGLQRSWLSRLFMRFYRYRYFRSIERRADVVVTLTNGDAQQWSRARRVVVIPNFSSLKVHITASNSPSHPITSSGSPSLPIKRVIAVGRLEWQKGFDRLIDAWSIIAPKHPQWHLDIFGSGTLEDDLKTQISNLTFHLSPLTPHPSISLHPFTADIMSEYARSSIFALSSRFEGFGLVLLEAMQCGVPCVVFDCPYGPSDVVVDGECGFVVPDGNIDLFAQRLAQLMDDEQLRSRFSAAALRRAEVFSIDEVMKQWQQLFLRH